MAAIQQELTPEGYPLARYLSYMYNTFMQNIRASDAKSWIHCPRRAWFDHNPPLGYENIEPKEFDRLVITLRNRHEQTVKQRLEKYHQVVDGVSEENTRTLMEAGTQIIYQGHLCKDDIIGIPDFLIRHDSGAYQPADAKFARSEEKKEIQIQLGLYRKLLGTNLKAKVFLGTGEVTEIGDEADKEVDKFLTGMREVLARPTPPAVRYSESKCEACGYHDVCKGEFKAKGELTLLHGIDSRAASGLEKQGIDSIRKLADADPATIKDVPHLKGIEKRQRAMLQAKSYFDDSFHQLKPIVLPGGTWIHFDIETNPLTESGEEHVYLWGFLKPPYDRGSFDYVWTDSEQQDQQGWDAFLAKIEQYRAAYPHLVLAHFSPYEAKKIAAYAKRYEMRRHPAVAWLLGDDTPLFDLLEKVVKECLVLPLASYGLKYICKHPKLVNFQWDDKDSGSQWSVVQYVDYLMTLVPDDRERLKRNILTYNFDDVMATRKLEEWLRGLK
jgi:uncharacterized protein